MFALSRRKRSFLRWYCSWGRNLCEWRATFVSHSWKFILNWKETFTKRITICNCESCEVLRNTWLNGPISFQVFEDLFDYMNSLQKLLSLKPDLMYPAHGALVNNPVEHITYYINHRNEREAQILAALSQQSTKSFTPMELVKIIYVVSILCWNLYWLLVCREKSCQTRRHAVCLSVIFRFTMWCRWPMKNHHQYVALVPHSCSYCSEAGLPVTCHKTLSGCFSMLMMATEKMFWGDGKPSVGHATGVFSVGASICSESVWIRALISVEATRPSILALCWHDHGINSQMGRGPGTVHDDNIDDGSVTLNRPTQLVSGCARTLAYYCCWKCSTSPRQIAQREQSRYVINLSIRFVVLRFLILAATNKRSGLIESLWCRRCLQ